VLVEGRAQIESDPIKWVDQDSQVVQDIEFLEDQTGFSSTLGILVAANNIYDQQVIDLLWDFTLDAEARPEVVSTSSLVNTMGKIILIPGATPVAPTTADLVDSVEQMPADIVNALLRAEDDPTATQLNLRLAPSSLDDRADFVADLEADLDARIEALDLPADSILLDRPERGSGTCEGDARRSGDGRDRAAREPVGQPGESDLPVPQPGRPVPGASIPEPVAGAAGAGAGDAGCRCVVAGGRPAGLHAEPADDGERATGHRELCRVLGADPGAGTWRNVSEDSRRGRPPTPPRAGRAERSSHPLSPPSAASPC
jgi:hypothetical protein